MVGSRSESISVLLSPLKKNGRVVNRNETLVLETEHVHPFFMFSCRIRRNAPKCISSMLLLFFFFWSSTINLRSFINSAAFGAVFRIRNQLIREEPIEGALKRVQRVNIFNAASWWYVVGARALLWLHGGVSINHADLIMGGN